MSGKPGVELKCGACGQRNRIPFGRLSQQPKCGACKQPLGHLDRPIELSNETDLETMLASADVPVLIDYWAPWCGPCRMVAPELEKVARARAGRLLVLKVNTERFQRIGARHEIRSIPTMAVFKDGREVGRTSGARPAPMIERYVDEQLARAA